MVMIFILLPLLISKILIPDLEEEKVDEQNNILDQFVRVKRENKNIIEKVPLEEYVAGVLAGEMPVFFELEAMKAQAVAARSYVLKRMEYNKDKNYDVVDTVNSQVYLDDEYLQSVWKESYETNINKIKQAVIQTTGEYLEYNGLVADTFYFSTSVGKTENIEDVFGMKVDYLRSVDSPWDKDQSPVFNDYYQFKSIDFYQKLGLTYQEKLELKVLKTTSTGRIKEIKINDKNFLGSDIVDKLSLRSNHFMIQKMDDLVIVKTTGYGHGVGMSQYGANGMALEGYKYEDILKHYYQGTNIKNNKM